MNSFDLRDAELSDMVASGPRQPLSVPELSPFLADSHVQERRDEHGSGGVALSFLCLGCMVSGEDGCFSSIKTEGSVEGEIAVIHALGRVFLHSLRKRVQQAPAGGLTELFV